MYRRLLLSTLFCLLAVAGRLPAAPPEPVEGDLFEQNDEGREAEAPPAPRRKGDNAPKSPPIIYDGSGDASGDVLMEGEGYSDGCGMDGGCCDGCGDCGECCDDCCGCGGCGGCGWYVRQEALSWWVRGQRLPPLVTTGPSTAQPPFAGAFPDATVLVPTERINGDGRVGGRLTIGCSADCCSGFDGNFFVLENQSFLTDVGSDAQQVIARPFFNEAFGGQSQALPVALPGLLSGTVAIRSSNSVMGGEANWRHACIDMCCRRVDFIAGYRFLRFDEDLHIDQLSATVVTQPNLPANTILTFSDLFGTENEFHGGQLGVAINLKRSCCWSLDLMAKCALGGMRQRVSISGSRTITAPTLGTLEFPDGGVLALGTNIGDYERTKFSAVPQFDLTLTRQLNCCWKFTCGYTFLYASNVVRPGDQIDTGPGGIPFINSNEFPPRIGPAGTRPRFAFNDSDVWMQGINLGLECAF